LQVTTWLILALFPYYCWSGEIEVATYIDLKRYEGRWHEIALLPNRFEKKCIRGVSAEYILSKDGTLKVTNTCQTAKGFSTVNGIAWVTDKTSQAKLKVSFVPFFKYLKWFGGDYWILYIDVDYQFAVVGTPNLKYLWLLARQLEVTDTCYQTFLDIASKSGFDVVNIKRRS